MFMPGRAYAGREGQGESEREKGVFLGRGDGERRERDIMELGDSLSRLRI